MAKNRTVIGSKIKDTGSITNEQYNEVSGGQKQIDVGPKLIAIPTATGGTTSATVAVPLPSAGRSVHIYNNSGTVGSVAFGDGTVSAPAPGVIDASGFVGIPCEPNAWTHLSVGDATFVRTTGALIVFLVDDDSSLVQQKR